MGGGGDGFGPGRDGSPVLVNFYHELRKYSVRVKWRVPAVRIGAARPNHDEPEWPVRIGAARRIATRTAADITHVRGRTGSEFHRAGTERYQAKKAIEPTRSEL